MPLFPAGVAGPHNGQSRRAAWPRSAKLATTSAGVLKKVVVPAQAWRGQYYSEPIIRRLRRQKHHAIESGGQAKDIHMPQQTNHFNQPTQIPNRWIDGISKWRANRKCCKRFKNRPHRRPIKACPVKPRDARRVSWFISEFPFGLVASVAEDVQQVFGLAWRTGDPSIKHRMDYQAVRAFGWRFGWVQGGQGEFLVLRRFEGAGLHGSRRWDERCRPAKKKILKDIHSGHPENLRGMGITQSCESAGAL